MLHYFYLIHAAFFRDVIHPSLAKSWQRRSFVSCHELCAEIVARSPLHIPDDALVRQVLNGLPFGRRSWHALVGQAILFGCEDMPPLQTSPATLRCLLGPEQYQAGDVPRSLFSP